MTERKLAQLIGSIDPALIAEAEESVPTTSKPNFRRAVIVLAAALLVLISLLSVAAIAFFPKTYDLDYEIPKHENAKKIAQIYYAEDGKIKRQSVLLPPTTENVYVTWAHLNGVGDEVSFICSPETLEGCSPNKSSFWDRLLGIDAGSQGLKVTLSAQMASYPDYESLIESLKETLAAYMGISPEFVLVTIDDVLADITKPGTSKVSGPWEFSYDINANIFKPGDTITITATMTNISDSDMYAMGEPQYFIPTVFPYIGNIGIALWLESANYPEDGVLSPGESSSATYSLPLHEYVTFGTFGTYSIDIYNDQDEPYRVTFAKAFIIAEDTHLNSDAKDQEPLHFYYLPSVASSPPTLGGRIVITVGMTNVSDQEIVFEGSWSDFVPKAKLLAKSSIYVAHEILPEPNDSTTEIAEYYFYPGESREVTYVFNIPEQAPVGAYDLTVSFGEYSYTFEEFVSVTELSTQVVFTSFMYDEFVYTLSTQQCEQFASMLERAERIADAPALDCDSSGTVGGIHFDYDSESGVLLMSGCTYTLTEQDRLKLNAMVSGTVFLYFDPGATVEVDSPYDDLEHYATLSEPHRDQIIAILNGGNWEWLPGGPNVQSGDHTLTVSDADTPLAERDKIQYHSETGLFVYNEYYLNISNADRLTVNEIFGGYAVQLPNT
ncbi:MAG: hypothetical protein IJW70_01365 [Clostridia bacterium]|nr:hypothetical protein [Clostridia bacterium]